MRRLLVCCLVLSLSLPLFAWNPKVRSFEEMSIEQRRVVSAYCRLDFQGARLAPQGWERIGNLTTFRENPDFNSFFVVSRYQLIENPTPSDEMDVAYVVIGRYEEGAGYRPMPSVVRNARFEMHDQNGELRISRIEPITPFVSRAGNPRLAEAKARHSERPGRPQTDRSLNPGARISEQARPGVEVRNLVVSIIVQVCRWPIVCTAKIRRL